ncbi:hypothetical protein J6590_055589 [Homalodisca vitripennis]|nr:hypothetical protein J6590_055589 [Homalodisca vitripennis]
MNRAHLCSVFCRFLAQINRNERTGMQQNSKHKHAQTRASSYSSPLFWAKDNNPVCTSEVGVIFNFNKVHSSDFYNGNGVDKRRHTFVFGTLPNLSVLWNPSHKKHKDKNKLNGEWIRVKYKNQPYHPRAEKRFFDGSLRTHSWKKKARIRSGSWVTNVYKEFGLPSNT